MTCGFCGSFRDDATRIVILRHGGVGRAEGFFIGECAVESGRSKQRPYAMNPWELRSAFDAVRSRDRTGFEDCSEGGEEISQGVAHAREVKP